MKKRFLWLRKARRSSLGRAVRVESSAVGANVMKTVWSSMGRMTPLVSKRVVLSLTVSPKDTNFSLWLNVARSKMYDIKYIFYLNSGKYLTI